MISFNTRRPRTGYSLYDKGVYPDDFTDEFKEYIRTRDGDRCAICGHKKKGKEPELDVHHTNFRKDTDKENCISLCRDCHTILHKDYGYGWRDWWWQRLNCLAQHREKRIKLTVEQKRQIVHDMREVIKAEK